MPSYKLTYFDIRGLAEGARLLFAYAGVKYEDVRLKMGSTDFKSKAPFGQVPLLEVDGVVIAQSFAIYRYLARQFRLAGTTPIEEALVDSVADAVKDFNTELGEFFMVAAGFKEGDKEKLYNEKVVPAREKLFPAIEKFLHKSGSGFVVGKEVTWADIIITERLATLQSFAPHLFDGHKEIKDWVDRIRELPKIKAWIAERPETKF